MPDERITDETLRRVQERSRAGILEDVWALSGVERAHLNQQPLLTADDKPKMGTIVIDRDGDAWRWGRTRWSCLTPLDGIRVINVGRLPQSALISQYGPIRIIGDKNSWRYDTIRGK
jgi:hypothetical protein